jgi:hypothetical protein
MITHIRTTVAQSGKAVELVGFAKEMAEIIGHIAGAKPTVATSFGGNANEVAWIMQAESLAQMEESMSKLMADAGYRAQLKKAEHLVVSGMTKDHIWRHI